MHFLQASNGLWDSGAPQGSTDKLIWAVAAELEFASLGFCFVLFFICLVLPACP